MSSATTRKSVWCDRCFASVFHDEHPEFAVPGRVEARTDFNVDLLALVQQWPAEWDQIRENENDLAEALNTLICETLIEREEWGPFWEPKGFIRVWGEEPELDWDPPRAARDGFFTRLGEKLTSLGLWGEEEESTNEVPAGPGPGQLALGEDGAP